MAQVKAISNFDRNGQHYDQGQIFEVDNQEELEFLLGAEAVVEVELIEGEAESDGRIDESQPQDSQPTDEGDQTPPSDPPADQGATATPAPLEGDSASSSEETPPETEPQPQSPTVDQPPVESQSVDSTQPTPEQIAEDLGLENSGEGEPVNVTVQ